MIRILFHDISSSGGGSTRSLRILYDHLDKNHFSGTFVFGDRSGERDWRDVDATYLTRLVGYPNYEFAPKPLSIRGLYAFMLWGFSSVRGYFVCKSILKTQQPQLVHLNSGSCTAMALAARSLKIPVVWHIRELHRANWLTKVWYEKTVLACANRVICISSAVQKRLPSLSSLTQILPNPAPDFSETDLTAIRMEQRKTWKINDSGFVVLLLGNFSPDKGYLFLHEVAQKVTHPDLCFVLAGSAVSKPAGKFHLCLRKLYRSFHPNTWTPEKIVKYWQSDVITSRVLFPGHLPASHALAAADLIVCPNVVPEPFGRTVVEAFAAQKAVVTSDLPAFDETIQHGENGWCLPLDPDLWANFLDDLVSHPEIRRQTEEKAYASRTAYDAKLYAEKIMEIYKMTLK